MHFTHEPASLAYKATSSLLSQSAATASHTLLQPAQSAHYHQSLPRSASEASMENNGSKYRQLPCRTFISVGTCPYRERCVYLHDPRCICREAKTKTRRKNKEDNVLDSLFWPIMPFNQVAGKLDSNRQPHVIQQYVVPPAQAEPYRRHDEAVYSMWMHFVDFCAACADSTHVDAQHAPCYQAPDVPTNMYTGRARLPVFRHLSSGRPAQNEASTASSAAREVAYSESKKGFLQSPQSVFQFHEQQDGRITRTQSWDSFESAGSSDVSTAASSSHVGEEGYFYDRATRPMHLTAGSVQGKPAPREMLMSTFDNTMKATSSLRFSPDTEAGRWTSLCHESLAF